MEKEIPWTISWVINDNNDTTTDTSLITTAHDLSVGESQKKEYNLLLEFIVVGIGITVVSLIGIIGNIISACVLSRMSMRSSISYLLLGLTLSDTLLIISSLLIFGLPVIFQYMDLLESNAYMAGFYLNYGHIIYAIAVTAQTSSVYFTIAVTLERYIVVCCPLQSRSLCTLKRTQVVSGGIFLFAILYNLPRWWELEGKVVHRTLYNPSTGSKDMKIDYQLELTAFRSNSYYIEYYVNWAYLLIMCLFPFVILVTLNVLIYQEIRRSNKNRHGIIAGPTRDYSFAPVLFVVVITFLICNTPALVINLMEALWKHFPVEMENISNFLITFNSSVNCAIYCAFGHKFREQLFQLRDEVHSSFCGLMRDFSRKLTRSLRIQLPP